MASRAGTGCRLAHRRNVRQGTPSNPDSALVGNPCGGRLERTRSPVRPPLRPRRLFRPPGAAPRTRPGVTQNRGAARPPTLPPPSPEGAYPIPPAPRPAAHWPVPARAPPPPRRAVKPLVCWPLDPRGIVLGPWSFLDPALSAVELDGAHSPTPPAGSAPRGARDGVRRRSPAPRPEPSGVSPSPSAERVPPPRRGTSGRQPGLHNTLFRPLRRRVDDVPDRTPSTHVNAVAPNDFDLVTPDYGPLRFDFDKKTITIDDRPVRSPTSVRPRRPSRRRVRDPSA